MEVSLNTSGEPDAVKEELERLQNAVAHLVRSNKELKELLQENGPDPDFKAAIEENIVTIAKYRCDIEGLKNQLKLMGVAIEAPQRGTEEAAPPKDSAQAAHMPTGPQGAAGGMADDVPMEQEGGTPTDAVGAATDGATSAAEDGAGGSGMWV